MAGNDICAESPVYYFLLLGGDPAFFFGIAAAIFFLQDIRKDTLEEAFYVMVIDSEESEEVVDELQEDLGYWLQLDPETQQCVVETGYAGEAGIQNEAMISAYMQTGRVDLLIAREEDFNRYAVTGYLLALSEEEFAGEEYFYAEKVDYSLGGAVSDLPFHPHEKSMDSDCYGIYIRAGVFKDYVVGVMVNTSDDVLALKGIEYFLS